jgi:hypothetical protein
MPTHGTGTNDTATLMLPATIRPLFVSLLLMLALAGCSDTDHFSFEGKNNEFCVPSVYVVQGPIWLAGVADDDGGFVFQGCGFGFNGPCDMPEIVSGGIVGPTAHMREHKWSDFYPTTEPRETTLAALRDHTFRIIADDAQPGYRILAINSKLRGATGVYYWQIPAEGSPRLEPSSALLAECGGVNDKRSPDAPEVAYDCSRTVHLGDAGLQYHFANGTINTEFVSELDARVTAGINKWRCKKTRS